MNEFIMDNGSNRIYFIYAKSLDRVKIGKTKDVKRRLRELQTAFPERLIILVDVNAPAIDEAYLHRIFENYRASGEWFEFSTPIKCLVIELLKDDGRTLRECLDLDENNCPVDKYSGTPTRLSKQCMPIKPNGLNELSVPDRIKQYREKGKAWVEIALIFGVTPPEVRKLA